MDLCKEPKCNCHTVEAQRKVDLKILKNIEWDNFPSDYLRAFVRFIHKEAL